MDWDFPLITCFLGFIFFVVLLSYYVYNALVRSLINERWLALVKFPILYLIGLVVLSDLLVVIYSLMIR